MTTHTAHRARESGFWGRLPLLLAMLAIAVQALVLQPHVHATGVADTITMSGAHADEAPTALAACSICRVSASARVFTTPPDIALPLAHGQAALASFVANLSIAATPSHAWRSRAPPISLR